MDGVTVEIVNWLQASGLTDMLSSSLGQAGVGHGSGAGTAAGSWDLLAQAETEGGGQGGQEGTISGEDIEPAPTGPVAGEDLGGSVGDLDLSIWGLFLRADWVVKSVIVVLILASFWTWAIIFEKATTLKRLNRRSDKFEEAFWSGGAVDDLYDRMGQRPVEPMSALFAAGMREWRRTTPDKLSRGDTRASIQQRIERVMFVTMAREMERIERFMTFLASVGSTAPFVGLFGTVWGIMNSFTAIAAQKNTNLAVVAPGIAEALFATALGLVAAIPAVLAYNKLSTDLSRYAARLESFIGEFSAILSRQLDEGRD